MTRLSHLTKRTRRGARRVRRALAPSALALAAVSLTAAPAQAQPPIFDVHVVVPPHAHSPLVMLRYNCVSSMRSYIVANAPGPDHFAIGIARAYCDGHPHKAYLHLHWLRGPLRPGDHTGLKITILTTHDHVLATWNGDGVLHGRV